MSQNFYPQKVDTSNCEKEPIHIIGKSQAHGVIVACDRRDLNITQIGTNSISFFGLPYKDYLGKPIEVILGDSLASNLKDHILKGILPEVSEIRINNSDFILIPHFSGESVILDFEVLESDTDPYKYQRQLARILNTLGSSETSGELCKNAARITKNIFGYDRVMIYKFDEEWNGEVIAEEKEESLESWLGLHYPASDIPRQSREMFLKNRIRVIADVNYSPVSIEPELSPINQKPLDLTKSELRGVSPIHIEYLQNMKVGATLTAALISNGKLWGLIACHHYSAKFINYYNRQTCEFLAQIFSNEITLKETNRYLFKLGEGETIKNNLIIQINQKGDISEGLLNKEILFTDLIESEGGALILEDHVQLTGSTPAEDEVRNLVTNFISKIESPVFYTKSLKEDFKEAINITEKASGILSIRLGQSNGNFLIWFRPEVVKNVNWGGNPDKKVNYDEEKQRITPRKSFQKWTEKLTGVSDSWKDYEISTAKALRESLNNIILERQKLKIARLNKEISEANKELELFSNGLSHDLKAPLRGVEGYAYILKEDYYHDLEKPARQAVDTILSSAGEMRELIENILSFAGVSGKDLKKKPFSVNHLIEDILESFNVKKNYPGSKFHIDTNLPKMIGDKRMLTQVWSNLIANALKYTETESQPTIWIGARTVNDKTVYFVRDNGIGFDQKYQKEIFELFSRFSSSKFKGTGIGLAITKKIIEKHSGEIWAESKPGKGAEFYFYV